MNRTDVDAKAAELRRSMDAIQRGGLVIDVGDLRWALDEDPANSATASSYSPGGDAGKCGDPGAVDTSQTYL
jgi:hypothetical protein